MKAIALVMVTEGRLATAIDQFVKASIGARPPCPTIERRPAPTPACQRASRSTT